MTFSASRLTCYALISAMESDLRRMVEVHWPELPLADLPVEVVDAAQVRRTKDRLPTARSVGALLPHTDFADAFEIIAARRSSLSNTTRDALDALAKGFTRIVAIRNQVAHTKPMQLDDGAFLADQAAAVVLSDREQWPTLAETMRRIDDNPAYVLGLTPLWRADEVAGTPFHNLPIPEFDETGFFGRREELKKLKRLIKGNYAIVSVLGTGGIGKTALTVQAAYDLLDDPDGTFEAIVWVTAKSAVITGTEVVAITDAIKDSLGLFSQAAEVLGGLPAEQPIGELRGYLETFKVLLILDNLETVLDPVLREFLADIPLGSKVILTSRISLGMLDNPISLGPLSEDEAVNLLYALCRARGVTQLRDLRREEVAKYAAALVGHPSYIRWFVAGLQAGRRPEDLLGDNGLILEYCMSNVYDYLDEEQQEVLSTFQVLPGAKNMAELAYLNDLSGEDTERVLLALLTTNFVAMSSHSRSGSLDSAYFLSDFAKEYLDRWHPVPRPRRAGMLQRSQDLRDQGAQFSVEMVATPYNSDTITIRGVEDAHVARILKRASASEVYEDALGFCREAQKLAPHYFETYRVEGDIRARMLDDTGALEAYERALPLSELASTPFHFGSYLLSEGIDVQRALILLQEAARRDPTSPNIAAQISWAQYLLREWELAFGAAKRVLDLQRSTTAEQFPAVVMALRAACQKIEEDLLREQNGSALEIAEEALELCETLPEELLSGESSDLLLWMRTLVGDVTPRLSGYYAVSASKFVERLSRLTSSLGVEARQVGRVARLVRDKGFGFIAGTPEDYFLHVYELLDSDVWDSLNDGELCCFELKQVDSRWRAGQVRVLRL
ncbi:NB-ARC domain-containing protein [Ornithinimicrobium faecis]|uniref:NB-ARC domain-containing protein n=1 Tax=Ornithinimicrobium faecis TaxID=2934158 RepID=A0ABY4YYP5_9MICO|nr:NB-ARC domain-containing protein [Ornithinimicrobium sp. HY1793]USQ81237.1 NB-ARC domain-containing protein [Ornithinimicrobium sp. HY1793]